MNQRVENSRQQSISQIFGHLLPKLARYSFMLLLSVVVLPEAVGAKKSTELQVAQQAKPIFQDDIRVTAKQAYADSFSENITREVFTSINTASLGLQIAQSPAIKPAPSEAEAKIKPLWDKAFHLINEALQLRKQPSAAALRQAITKYEEALKIFRLPEVRAAKPQEAPFVEAVTLSAIGGTYSHQLTEPTKGVKYLEQALAIVQESKDPKARDFKGELLYVLGGVYWELGEKQKSIDAYKQMQSIFHAENKPREEAKALLGIALVYTTFGEPKKARDSLEQALVIQKANNDLSGQADTLVSIGGNYSQSGEKENALHDYEEALKIYQQTKDLFGQARTLTYIGSVYSDKGDRSSTEKYFQQALDLQKTIQRQLQPKEPSANIRQGNGTQEPIKKAEQAQLDRLKYISNQIGILQLIASSYLLLGDIPQQIVYLNQGSTIARETGITKQEAGFISSIGLAYIMLGETQKGMDHLNQALKLQRDIQDSQGEAATLVEIASIYKKSGEFQQALDQLNQVLEISKKQQNRLLETNTLYEIANVYEDLGAYDLSIDIHKERLEIFRQSNRRSIGITVFTIGSVYLKRCYSQKTTEDCRQALDYFKQALEYDSDFIETRILSFNAKAYELLKDYPQAIADAKQALELSRKNNLKDAENLALAVLSAAYEGSGDYQKALDTSKQFLLSSQQLGDVAAQASVYKIQGKIHASMKQPQQAIEAYNQELKLAQQIGDTSQQTFPLYNIAIIERNRGNLNQAKTQIEAAIKIVETTRSKVNSNDLRTSYFATVQDYYKFYIDLLMQLHKKNPSQGYDALALHISERSRARSLIELLKEANAKILKGANPELIAQESDLRQKIDAKDTLRLNLQTSVHQNDPHTKATIQTLSTEINNLLGQYKEIQAKIRTNNPEYAKLTNPDPEKDILKLPQIQQQLDKDTLLLQYSLGEERSYLWAVTPTSMQVYTLPPRKEIEKVAVRFHSSLQQETARDLAIENAKELSKLILAPVADKLALKRLVVVADGALQTIPFAALADLSANKYQPLIVNHEIVNLPSASTIAFQRQQLANRKPAPKALAILADPVYSATDERVTGKPEKSSLGSNLELERSALGRSARSLKRDGWGRLINTATEAKEILKLIPPGSSLEALNFDANYNWATSSALTQFRILHFATHGFVNQDQPELSGIVLSLVDKKGNTISGHLRLADLFNQDYPAELIVLSACETGLGKNINGEGLVGLTRGLMYAGAGRVAVSLWQVSDEGTSVLMQEFYKQMLQQGKTPVQAMRAAQRKLWQDGRSPNEWAAFTVQGEWR